MSHGGTRGEEKKEGEEDNDIHGHHRTQRQTLERRCHLEEAVPAPPDFMWVSEEAPRQSLPECLA